MMTHYQVLQYKTDLESCQIVEYKNDFDSFRSARNFAERNNDSGYTIIPVEKVTETEKLTKEIAETNSRIFEHNERIIAWLSFILGCIGYAYLLFFWSHS